MSRRGSGGLCWRNRPCGPVRADSRSRAEAGRRAPTVPARSSRPRRARGSTSHIATTSSMRRRRWTIRSMPGQPAGQICAFTCISTGASRASTRSKSACCGELSRRSRPSSRHVVTSATGRSRLMCAFIPASANCSGAIPRRERCANSGTHADGALAGSGSYDVERGEEQPAKWTSSVEEASVGEAGPCRSASDALGHREVEPGEAGDSVRGRSRRLDRPEALDDIRNAHRSIFTPGQDTTHARSPAGRPGFVLDSVRPWLACRVYGFGTPGKSASPIVGMNCGGTRLCVACS